MRFVLKKWFPFRPRRTLNVKGPSVIRLKSLSARHGPLNIVKYPGGRRGGVAGVVASCLRAYCGAVQTLNHWIRGVDQDSAARIQGGRSGSSRWRVGGCGYAIPSAFIYCHFVPTLGQTLSTCNTLATGLYLIN